MQVVHESLILDDFFHIFIARLNNWWWQKVSFHDQSGFWESGPFTNPGTNQIVTTIGWGQESDSSSGISSVLREVDVPIMSNSDCDAVYGNVNDGHICIDSTGGKGTCSVSL